MNARPTCFQAALRPSEKRVALLGRVCAARHARGFWVRLSLPLGYSVSACVAEPHTLRRRLRPSEKRGFMPPLPLAGEGWGGCGLGRVCGAAAKRFCEPPPPPRPSPARGAGERDGCPTFFKLAGVGLSGMNARPTRYCPSFPLRRESWSGLVRRFVFSKIVGCQPRFPPARE